MQPAFPVYSIGHFINQPGNRTQFEITLFGSMDEPEVDDPHKHTFYELIWIDEGESSQAIDYQNYRLSPQSLFFISPGQLHLFEEWEHLNGGSVLFTEDFFLLNHQDKDKLFELSFLDNFYANSLLQLNDIDFRDIRHTIDLLCREHGRPDRSAAITQSLLHVLLTQIQRCVDAQAARTPPRKYVILFKQLKSLVDQHFAKNWPVSEYAARLNITPHHLNVVCKDVTGRTAGDVIRGRSLLEAKRLLSFTDLAVGEIAALLGFFDSSYFARIFRADTGMAPAEFKQTMSQTYRLK